VEPVPARRRWNHASDAGGATRASTTTCVRPGPYGLTSRATGGAFHVAPASRRARSTDVTALSRARRASAMRCTCSHPPSRRSVSRARGIHGTAVGRYPRKTRSASRRGSGTVRLSPGSTSTRSATWFSATFSWRYWRATGFFSTANTRRALPRRAAGIEKYPMPAKRSTTVSPGWTRRPTRARSVRFPAANMTWAASNRQRTPCSLTSVVVSPPAMRSRRGTRYSPSMGPEGTRTVVTPSSRCQALPIRGKNGRSAAGSRTRRTRPRRW
jgi:hypothetical protein